jgi:hypothetical protein
MMTANNRSFPRHELGSPAVILLPGFYVDATALDVSQSGALIEVPDIRLIPRNATCVIRLLSANSRQLVEFQARVVRFAGTRRIGFQNRNVSAGALGALRRLLTETTPQTEYTTRREVCALLRPAAPDRLQSNTDARNEMQVA